MAGITYVTEVSTNFPLPLGVGRGEGLRDFTWRPEGFGIQQQSLTDLSVDGPAASAALIRQILAGNPGPTRDIVILNAAAGLLAADKAPDPKTAATQAAEAIDSGAARTLLTSLAERSHE
jgi:anthranilate phosphoribosyltransferase